MICVSPAIAPARCRYRSILTSATRRERSANFEAYWAYSVGRDGAILQDEKDREEAGDPGRFPGTSRAVATAAGRPRALLWQPHDHAGRSPDPRPRDAPPDLPLQVRPPRIRRHLRGLGHDGANDRVVFDDREDQHVSPLRGVQSHAPLPGDLPDVSPRSGGMGPAREMDEPHVPYLPPAPGGDAGPARLRERADGLDRVPASRRRPGRHPRRRAGGPRARPRPPAGSHDRRAGPRWPAPQLPRPPRAARGSPCGGVDVSGLLPRHSGDDTALRCRTDDAGRESVRLQHYRARDAREELGALLLQGVVAHVMGAKGDGRLHSNFRQRLTLLGTFSALDTCQPIELPCALPGSALARE